MDNTHGELCGKTCPEPCLPMRGAISRPFSAAWPKSKTDRQMFLCLIENFSNLPVFFHRFTLLSYNPNKKGTSAGSAFLDIICRGWRHGRRA